MVLARRSKTCFHTDFSFLSPCQATCQAVQARGASVTAEVGVGSTGCLLWQSVIFDFVAEGVDGLNPYQTWQHLT